MIKQLKDSHLKYVDGDDINTQRYIMTLTDCNTNAIIRMVDYKEQL